MTASTSTFLECDPASAGRARHFVRSALNNLLDTAQLEIIELLTSELVTNAIMHAGSPPHVYVDIGSTRIRVEVRDQDHARLPVQRPDDPTATSGRGIAIVASMASDWGFEIEPRTGKVVWFEIPR